MPHTKPDRHAHPVESTQSGGVWVGYAVAPPTVADDLNEHNDAYPLARPSEAAAIATLQNDDKIRDRVAMLRQWTEELADGLRALEVRTSRPKPTSSSPTSHLTLPGPWPTGLESAGFC